MKKVNLSIVLFIVIMSSIKFSSFANDNLYMTFGAEPAFNRLQNTFNINAKLFYQPYDFDIYTDTNGRRAVDAEKNWYFFQFEHSLLGYDWIVNDEYNNYKYNHSFISNISFPTAIILGLLDFNVINKRRDKETPSWWIFIPFAITNPQIDFGYLNIETNKKSRFSSYVYYHHKIDYFAKNENDFWRFKVGLGLGVEYFLLTGERADPFNIYSIRFDYGYDIMFDYALDKWHNSKLVPSFKLTLSFGGSWRMF